MQGAAPARRRQFAAGRACAREARNRASFVVSLSTFRCEAMAEYADVILPVSAFAETEGTFVNLSGTWQSFGVAAPPYADSRPAWRVLRVLGNLFELNLGHGRLLCFPLSVAVLVG